MGNNQPACPRIFEHERWYDSYSVYRKESVIGKKYGTLKTVGIVCAKHGVFIKVESNEQLQPGWQQFNKGRFVTLPEAAGEQRRRR